MTAETNRQSTWGYVCRIRMMLFLMASIGFLYGCAQESPQEAETRRIEREIAEAVKGLPKVLERGEEVRKSGAAVKEKIAQLPDRTKQVEWFRKAIEEVFKTEIGHLPLDRQYRSICVITDLWSAIGSGWTKVGWPSEEIWQSICSDLAWKKKQLERLEKEYAEVKPRTWSKPMSESRFSRIWGLKGIVKSVKVDYDAQITSLERRFWRNKKQLPSENWDAIRQKFEAELGRPIRTLEQMEQDRLKRAEAFRRAEEAAESKTNKPPPLILIDGDL